MGPENQAPIPLAPYLGIRGKYIFGHITGSQVFDKSEPLFSWEKISNQANRGKSCHRTGLLLEKLSCRVLTA